MLGRVLEPVFGRDVVAAGRARGVLEAVLWHGGEAEAAKDQVLKMKKAERDALVKFVESL